VKRFSMFMVLSTLVMVLLACNASGTAGSTPTPSPTMTVTGIPTTLPATATTSGGATAVPSSTPTTSQGSAPTATRPAATSAPTRPANTAAPSATWAGAKEVFIYLIAMEDNGASGPKIGCNDSIIEVKRVLSQPTQSPLRAAYEELLSIKDDFYGESGLFNSLWEMDLTVDSVNITNGKAIVQLSGDFHGVGTCADPRMIAQLEYTALQFSTVTSVEITINGVELHEFLSVK
jgi:spore germination protein GerM